MYIDRYIDGWIDAAAGAVASSDLYIADF